MEELVIPNIKDQNQGTNNNRLLAFVDTGVRMDYKPNLLKKRSSRVKPTKTFRELIENFKTFCSKKHNQLIAKLTNKLVKKTELSMENHTTLNGYQSKEKKVPSSEIIERINYSLSKFESEKKYLSPEVSLQNLASSFGTNRNYLSKVINLQKGKSFPHYINNLRIEYSKNELNINARFRKYTIRAIAEECGFKSAESFSKTFNKTYGIYPSTYLKNLESLEEKISV